MKKFIILLTILSMIVVLLSCKVQDDDDPNSPTDPDIITLSVTNPTSNEVLYAVSVYDIKWSSNTTQTLKIEYTIDNGLNWNLLATEVENTGSHLWTPVPNTLTTQGRIRITTADGALSALSEGFFSIVQGSEKSLILSSPNGGETWNGNSIQIIKWFSSGVDSVTLEYTMDNGLTWSTIVPKVPSNGVYNWNPVPNTPSSIAKVRVRDAQEGLVQDESNSVFTIGAADMITLTSPNGGEEWLGGSSQYIQWNTLQGTNTSSDNSSLEIESGSIKLLKGGEGIVGSNGSISSGNSIENIDNVKIEYSVNGGSSWNTIVESTPNNGIYFLESVPVENSANCVIRVSDAIDGLPFDLNDIAFSIFATLPKEIIVIKPNGGEAWPAGSSQDIKWSSKDVSFVKIEYTTNNGVDWTTIVESTQSDGFYTWQQLPTGAATNCRLRITDSEDGISSDLSDGLFSITPEPSINLTSPNGGEALQSGSSISINWTSENIARIKIEYTINGGAEWMLIADNVVSTGSYTWDNIPDVNSNQVKIKISDADDGAPSDISANNFTISNQIVQNLEVTSPNGGETWEANTAKNITWTSSAVTHVKIEFTENNGLDWVVVEDNLPSSGSYDWSVPNVNSTQAKVRISDAIDGDPIDESNGTFRVKQAGTLKLIAPATGDNWLAGELNRIEWVAENIEKVKIEFTTTNAVYDPTAAWFDDEWSDLITSAPGAAGFYETRFTIPSNNYRLRISDAELDEPIDFSGLFTVIAQPEVTLEVLHPNGGEQLDADGTAMINWQSENVENIKIEYSSNNGSSWTTLVESTPTDPGAYVWDPLPSTETTHGIIRISDASRTDVFDVSDATFLIKDKIDQVAGEPASIYLVKQSLDAIGVTESGSPETAQITFEVQDSAGVPIDFAHAVEVGFRFGSHPNGGEILAPNVLRTNEKGQVTVNLTSGTIAGAVQVIAEIDFNGNIIRSNPVNIAIHGGMPELAHFSVGPQILNYPYLGTIGEVGSVTALVGDRYSNPVRPGTVVYFDSDAGVIQGSNLTNGLGLTTVTFVSGNPQPNDPVYGPGFFRVYANTIDENDADISTSTLVLFSGAPIVNAAPATFTVPNGGSQVITYTVMDINGNPLSEGNQYSVSIASSGDAEVTGAIDIEMPDTQFGHTSFSFVVSDGDAADIDPPAQATVTIKVEGPNGIASMTIGGTVD